MINMDNTQKIKKRKTRKATQHKINPDTGRLVEYYVDVPLELEDWEKEGLQKQFEERKKRGKGRNTSEDKKLDE